MQRTNVIAQSETGGDEIVITAGWRINRLVVVFTLNACRNWLALSLPRTGRFEAVIGGRLDPKIKATWGKQLTKSKLLPDHFLRKE
ncbi:MAG: hypothetical protein KDA88_15260, partial [Planctomycetaceae bacterium]|nr:hypothetical protein [Planctomycetaceae bacterium]